MVIPGKTLVLVGLVSALVGCGAAPRATEPSDPEVGAQVPSLEDPGPCDDQGACAEGFSVDGTFHSTSCGAVRPDLVSDEVLAAGRWAGEHREVRRIEGVDPAVLVAIHLDAGQCDEGADVLSPWSMAFPDGASEAAVREAVCAATVREHRERNGC